VIGYREFEELRREVERVRRGIVRHGSVSSVDSGSGKVVVKYDGEDAGGAELKSLPMPWLQRSTEHRPPVAGDHVVVLDPSLGNGGALAICGWPSDAKPPAGGGGNIDVIFRDRSGPNGDVYDSGTRTTKSDHVVIDSADVKIGQNPTDFAALAQKVLDELNRVKVDFDALKSALTTIAGVAPSGGGAVVFTPWTTTIPTAHTPGSVAASQVKVK